MNEYLPGIHIIATLQSSNVSLLSSYEQFKACIEKLITQFELQNLGEVYHNFLPAGFTAVICLSESHISIHTWPEFGKINLDIYLSNYLRNNDGTVQTIFKELITFFEATIVEQHFIQR
ncbi:MAG: S-adenosylmethionine decarboxylase family protein [Chitinophagaceae bacterium]|jgi:S-adenosylmethionine decarboxylase